MSTKQLFVVYATKAKVPLHVRISVDTAKGLALHWSGVDKKTYYVVEWEIPTAMPLMLVAMDLLSSNTSDWASQQLGYARWGRWHDAPTAWVV